jgi:peptidyl-prolyl cis-trans isomerase D
MLDSFRTNMRGIAIGITILIGAVFAFSGTGALMIPGIGSEAALLVNGVSISELEVLRAVDRSKQRILSGNDELDASLLDDEMIRPSAIQQLIGLEVLIQEARSNGMSASEEQATRQILDSEAFQSDGVFDQDTYRYMLQSGGYTSASYKQLVKTDLITQQLVSGVSDTNFITENELAALASITEQKRDFYYLTVPVSPIREGLVLSDEQQSDYYEDNKESYKTDPMVSVDYIELNPSQLADPSLINDDLIADRFQEELNNRDMSESRQAAHILLIDPSEEHIAEVQGKILAGEEFVKLASEYSEDFGSSELGGDLGFTSGNMFPEEFEKALKSLEIGAVSDAVKTDAGTHFIKLLAIQQESFLLEDEQDRISQELMREATSDALIAKLELMKELSFNAESLADVAEDVGLPLGKTELFSRKGGKGVAAIPEVISKAFSTEVVKEKYASEVLELGNDRYLVLKLSEYVDARQLELFEVKNSVLESLTEASVSEVMAAKGTEILARIDAGDSIESLAKEEGFEWQVGLSVSRRGGQVSQEVTSRVFAMPIPGEDVESESFYLSNGDLAIASLTKVIPGELGTVSQANLASLTDALTSMKSSSDMQAFQQILMNRANVEQ